MKLYLDASALVKLVVAESESPALLSFLRENVDDDLFTADLARTELIRAVTPAGPRTVAEARNLLRGIDTVTLTRQLLDDAGSLEPQHLRSLDAIHLAAARRAGDALRAVVTYDARMISAAETLGIVVEAPGQAK